VAVPNGSSSDARVSLRPARPEDEDFLRRVYGSTRAEELASTGWDEAMKDAFIAQQFDAQQTHYRANYEDATYDVVMVDDVPAGRLSVARWGDEIRVMDIALLPEYRGRGVGTHLLDALLEEADAAGRSVSIHVERNNPALSLYRRLGFEAAGERGIYLLMKRAARGD
jgi:ribosomal protein S18 acetylase RimI-like enzyme